MKFAQLKSSQFLMFSLKKKKGFLKREVKENKETFKKFHKQIEILIIRN